MQRFFHALRSELLSLSLEAEKQSARHQQAATDAALETARFAVHCRLKPHIINNVL